MIEIRPKDMARYIDHTLLKADVIDRDILRLCEEAKAHGFFSVCVNTSYVSLAAKFLKESDTKVCTVVDFPLGASTQKIKNYCARQSVEEGARELDVVMNISAMKSKDYNRVEEEIHGLVQAVPEDIVIKVILEVCYLTDEEIEEACRLSLKAGADFVKTSTGFGSSGATLKAIDIMRRTVGRKMGIKASGGIRDFETAAAMIRCGATRIGTSSGLRIMGAE